MQRARRRTGTATQRCGCCCRWRRPGRARVLRWEATRSARSGARPAAAAAPTLGGWAAPWAAQSLLPGSRIRWIQRWIQRRRKPWRRWRCGSPRCWCASRGRAGGAAGQGRGAGAGGGRGDEVVNEAEGRQFAAAARTVLFGSQFELLAPSQPLASLGTRRTRLPANAPAQIAPVPARTTRVCGSPRPHRGRPRATSPPCRRGGVTSRHARCACRPRCGA